MTPDGRRFLLYTLTEESSVSPITIIQNWRPRQGSTP